MTAANSDLLNSWKEIADYLGCDERTCRRWELNLGLPIHRMEGTAKSRVYAYRAELDFWGREKLNGVAVQITASGLKGDLPQGQIHTAPAIMAEQAENPKSEGDSGRTPRIGQSGPSLLIESSSG